MKPDFFEETFGPCPHDGIKPYCPQCVGDELEEKWAKRREKREARKTEDRLQETVASQSEALDDAHLLMQHLQRRLRRHPR